GPLRALDGVPGDVAPGRDDGARRRPPADRAEREPLPQRRRAGAVGSRVELSQDREHPDDRRPRAEERSQPAKDEELRQEVAQGDQADPGRDEPPPRLEARPRRARETPLSVRTRLRSLAGEAGLDSVARFFRGGAAAEGGEAEVALAARTEAR